MQDLQAVFIRIQEAKQKQKEIRNMYKDALGQNSEYQEIQESMKSLREKKKRVETAIKEQFASEMTRFEDLKIDIESDTEMLSDIALTKYAKGETVGVTDSNNIEYSPVFKVAFKKVT